jgi:hypothetical protein
LVPLLRPDWSAQPYYAEDRRLDPSLTHWRIIESARAGRSVGELEASSNPQPTSRQWIKHAALDEGLHSDGLITSVREDLNRLRHENPVLREEREIPAKLMERLH